MKVRVTVELGSEELPRGTYDAEFDGQLYRIERKGVVYCTWPSRVSEHVEVDSSCTCADCKSHEEAKKGGIQEGPVGDMVASTEGVKEPAAARPAKKPKGKKGKRSPALKRSLRKCPSQQPFWRGRHETHPPKS